MNYIRSPASPAPLSSSNAYTTWPGGVDPTASLFNTDNQKIGGKRTNKNKKSKKSRTNKNKKSRKNNKKSRKNNKKSRKNNKKSRKQNQRR